MHSNKLVYGGRYCMKKYVMKYAKLYRNALVKNKFSDIEARLEKVIDVLPKTYQIAKKWNIFDHENRVKDGSITYDYFHVSEGKIEYRISKCMYIEMFEYYGIRGLCKIFCLTDETAYANLPKHVKFIRHSDLSYGKCCHDEVIDRKYWDKEL